MFIKIRTIEELKEILDRVYKHQHKFEWYMDLIKDIFCDDSYIQEEFDKLEPEIKDLKDRKAAGEGHFDSLDVDLANLNCEIADVLDGVKLPVYMNIAELGTAKTCTVYVDVFHEDDIIIDDLEDICQQICDIFELGSNPFSS